MLYLYIKAVAYTSLVRPLYASAAWDPHSQNNIKRLERIQRQAARFCTNNYSRGPGSVTKLLQELRWEILQTRRKSKRITTLYKMEHNIIDIPLDQYIKHNTRCSRKHNCQFLQIRHKSNTFGHSFFLTTAKEWNTLPSNIISSNSIESFQKNLDKYLIERQPTNHHAHWRGMQNRNTSYWCLLGFQPNPTVGEKLANHMQLTFSTPIYCNEYLQFLKGACAVFGMLPPWHVIIKCKTQMQLQTNPSLEILCSVDFLK